MLAELIFNGLFNVPKHQRMKASDFFHSLKMGQDATQKLDANRLLDQLRGMTLAMGGTIIKGGGNG